MRRVTIIGGGIAGLASAFYLQSKARERGLDVAYTLVESAPRLGGKIATERWNGFVIDGGPDSFINQKPQGLQLCRDLGLEPELLPSNDETYRTRLVRNGRLIPFPDGFRLAVPTRLLPFLKSPLLSPLGKLRMGLDLVLPARRDPSDESLAQFITRRLGREALENIAGPIMSGIYVSDPERMSVISTFPMFVELERKYRSLTLGILKARRARRTPAVSIFTSLRGGMGALVDRIAERLEGRVLTGTEVRSVSRSGSEYRCALSSGEVVASDELIVATPAFAAADLLEPLHTGLAQRLRGIRYVSSAVINLVYPDSILKSCIDGGGFGFVVPRRESCRLLAFTWTSRKFDGRAAAGYQLVRVFVGGSRHEELVSLADDALLDLIRAELAATLKIEQAPERSWIFRWPRANAQFDVGHQDRVGEMERLAAEVPGLHLAGGAYRGIGIPDCTKSALAAVERIINRN